MKLTIRPLGAGQRGKDVFVVEAEPSQTIHDLKLRISEQGFPVEAQNILSTGKSLQDDKTIASYGIKDASTLVLMIKAASAAVTPAASKNNSPRTAPSTLSTQPTVPTAGTTSANRLTVPSPAYAAPSAPPVASSSSSLGISETAPGLGLGGAGISSNVGASQSNIDQIVGMGFTQAQAVRALRACSDNLDQAVELLLNDPDNLGAPGASQAGGSMANGLANGFLASGSGSANGTASQSSGLPQSLIPQNLMKMVAQQQQQQELPDLSSMSLGALGGLGGGAGGGASGGTSGGASGGASSGPATAEVTAEQIEEIRRLVAYNPILTGPLLEQIKGEDPDLYNYIDGDPEKLLLALSRGPDDTGSGGPPVSTPPTSFGPPALPPAAARPPTFAPAPAPMPGNVPQPPTGAQTTTISVTREEAEQIEGIVGMGFDRQTVLQAYLACDRNVERAVEFLLAGAFE